MFLCHVTQEGEYDEPREEAGQRVDGAGDDGVSVTQHHSFQTRRCIKGLLIQQ